MLSKPGILTKIAPFFILKPGERAKNLSFLWKNQRFVGK